MERGTASAHVVRVIAALLAGVGTLLASGGIAALLWLRDSSDEPDIASALLGGAVVALAIGVGQAVLGAVLTKWVKRHRALEGARKQAFARPSIDHEKPEVPLWARRTPHTQREEDPTETTDTWALLEAMRADRHSDNA